AQGCGVTLAQMWCSPGFSPANGLTFTLLKVPWLSAVVDPTTLFDESQYSDIDWPARNWPPLTRMSVLGPPAVTLRLMKALAGQGGPLAGQASASAALRAPGRRVASKAAGTTARTMANTGPRRHASAGRALRTGQDSGCGRRRVQ